MRSCSQSDCMCYVTRSSSPRPFLCALAASQTVCIMLHALPPPARSYALLQPVRLYVLCYNPQTEQHERANAAPSVDCN